MANTNITDEYDFFYGSEADQFTFYRIPKTLIVNPKFSKLSTDAKLLYGLMLDRMSLSRKNGWIDNNNRVYIVFTLNDAIENLNKSHTTCSRLFKELEKYHLLSRVVRGGRKACCNLFTQCFLRRTSRSPKSGPPDCKNLAPNNNKYNIGVIYKPELQHIRNYINFKNYNLNAEYFYNYYENHKWILEDKPIEDFEEVKILIDRWENDNLFVNSKSYSDNWSN